MRTSFEHARLLLARLHLDEARREPEMLQHAARISAQALGVERVGIWLLDPPAQHLRCAMLYTRTGGPQEVGSTIPDRDAPPYFAALAAQRVIATGDAMTDPVTQDLAEHYLAPRGIGAMLDAPIYVDGTLHGVVCHEHIGGPRVWTSHEVDFAGSFADILASLFLQRQLRQQEAVVRGAASRMQDAAKLANLTHITRAFAHDVNNALTVAMLYGGRLAHEASPDLVAMGQELQAAAGFGTRVLRELQQFASREGEDEAPIGDIIETFRPVLGALLRGVVTLELVIETPALVPAVSRTHVEQILMNLCINARDASPAGGTVRVRVHQGPAVGDPPRPLVLEVTDHGTGIAAELLPRIFEPYVTTKPDGSGLGLAIVRGIVTDSDGSVDVHSVPGEGTTFTVTLPVRQAPALGAT